jgi:predicted dienelactone hydrolase
MISQTFDGATDNTWDATNFTNGAARSGAVVDYKFNVYAPDTPGTYKVIVFSHGNGGNGAAVEDLAAVWTQQGYIVIAPFHADSGQGNYDQADVVTEMNTSGLTDEAEIAKFRVDDLRIAMDIAEAYAPTGQGGGGLTLSLGGGNYQFDITEPVVAGHSRGSNAAAIAGGANPTYSTGFFSSTTYTDWDDPRFEALMTFSGGGPAINSDFAASNAFTDIDIPWLRVTGSLDLVDTSDDVSDRIEPLFASSRSDAHAVLVRGATHSTIKSPDDTTPPTGSPDAQDHFDASAAASQHFLDYYIGGIGAALTDLQAVEVASSQTLTTGGDSFAGTSADDIRFGRAGQDVLSGADGADELYGGGDRDTLTGGAGDDVLNGGAGRDDITGGAGADTMVGGRAGDDFIFSAITDSGVSSGRDLIIDFDDAGDDVIDVSAIDANTGAGGNQAFSYIGTSAFTAAGQLRVEASGDDVLVHLNTDGDLDPEMTIVLLLTTTGQMSSGDFIL